MSYLRSRPKWWQLYLTFPLLVILFVVESRLKISARGHQAMQIGIVLLVYGLTHLWLQANAKALQQIDEGQYPSAITVIEIPPIRLPDLDKRQLFPVPDSEIKGVLSDTFETDFIDAVAFPVDEVSQESGSESAHPR